MLNEANNTVLCPRTSLSHYLECTSQRLGLVPGDGQLAAINPSLSTRINIHEGGFGRQRSLLVGFTLSQVSFSTIGRNLLPLVQWTKLPGESSYRGLLGIEPRQRFKEPRQAHYNWSTSLTGPVQPAVSIPS